MSLSKIEELEINRIVAPSARHADKRKRIKTLDSQGRPTGRTVSHVELVEKQFLREGIEITRDPKKGERPQALYCKDCGVPFKVPKKGRVLLRCSACHRDYYRCTKILDNGDRCSNSRKHGPKTRRCKEHPFTEAERIDRQRDTLKRVRAAMTPEQRSDISRRVCMSRPIEVRRASADRMRASMTPDELRERGRRLAASLTPEQRKAIGRKNATALTPEQRKELGRRSLAKLTPEQRKEMSRKGGLIGSAARWGAKQKSEQS